MLTANSGLARNGAHQMNRPGAAIIGGRGTRPQHFGWGDANVNVPPTDCPFSKIFRTYFRLDKISFQLQGSYDPLTRGSVPGPRWGSAPKPPTIQKKSPPLEPAELSQ